MLPDIARIELVSAIESAASPLSQCAQTVGEDLAQAGDYARRAKPSGRSIRC